LPLTPIESACAVAQNELVRPGGDRDLRAAPNAGLLGASKAGSVPAIWRPMDDPFFLLAARQRRLP
jgi:hypothetical protein